MTNLHIISQRFGLDLIIPLRWVEHRDLNTRECSVEAEVLIPMDEGKRLLLHFVNGGWLSPTGNEITVVDARYGDGDDDQIVVEDIRCIEIQTELEDILTTSEAAKKFGIEPITVIKNIERGNIPARKSGGTWLIRRSDAEQRWGKK